MKSAEEVAIEIEDHMDKYLSLQDGWGTKGLRDPIIKMVTAFAEERVKEVMEKQWPENELKDFWMAQARAEALAEQKCKDCGCTYEGCCCNPIREMKARNEALEEAAQVPAKVWLNGASHTAESFMESVVQEIRALKGKPE